MVHHATTPLAPRVMTTTRPPFVLVQGLGERGGVDVLWLTGKVPQEVHLVDAAVDEYPTPFQVSTAAPLPWLKGASSAAAPI